MITEQFVTYETAKLLKATGFPQDDQCYARYNRDGRDWHIGDGYGYTLKPTQSLAMRWLREEKAIFVWIDGREIAETKGIVIQYQFKVRAKEYKYARELRGEYFVGLETVETSWYKLPTYEAAAEAGIQAACKYLIEKGGEK